MISAEKATVGEVVVDHTSATGPQVTHVRGTLLVNSLRTLEESGFMPTYLELIPGAHRDAVRFAVAASWVPIDHLLAHYETCDRLDLSDAALERAGTAMSARIAETFLSGTLRASRPAGVEAVWPAMSQSHRLWARMYQGGGFSIIKKGPKDAVAELRGVPLVACRYFKVGCVANTLGLLRLLCKNAFIKPTRPRVAHPHTLAMAISWV